MERDLQKQNFLLKNTIKDLELALKALRLKDSHPHSFCPHLTQNKDIPGHNDNTCHSIVEYSPIHTFESLQEEAFSLETQQKSYLQEIPELQTKQNLNQTEHPSKQSENVKFDVEDHLDEESHMANSSLSKDLELEVLGQKKLNDPSTPIEQIKSKTVYNSAIKEKNICQECVTRMHQMHEMEFLKNKYHREYISLRAELDKVKSELNEHQSHQTPRSSINLIEFYGDHATEEKSDKSSFSFENIQNALLSERFALQIEQCIKLIDKLLPLDRKFIQLSNGDFKLLMDLQMKIEKLKSHLGLQTEPKYLDDLFTQLEKYELQIKKVHQRYKKLIQKICKVHKQKVKRTKDQFNEVSNKFVGIFFNLTEQKNKNEKLKSEIAQLKSELALHDLKEPKTVSLSSSHEIKPSSFRENPKESVSQEVVVNKDKDLHETQSSQCEKASGISEKNEKEIQRLQAKLKSSQKYGKMLEKMIKEQKGQILSMKKKYVSDFNHVMNSIIFQKNSKLRTWGQQTEPVRVHEQVSLQQDVSERKMEQKCQKILIQEIGGLVYEIFSFTSWESEEGDNMFLPENQTEILQMLKHIKKFAQKFDEWQKQKQKEINGFQKNLLHLLKFFIDEYKVSQERLLQEISRIKDNEGLAVYIKRYYERAVELSDSEERESSSFTFGQKSETNEQP